MAVTVSDIIRVLDSLAPRTLAEEWDNVGLQIGDPNQSVKSVWISLDPTLQVVGAACRSHVDLLVTHHPLFFRPLKSIGLHTPVGAIIDLATRHQLAIVAAHTNLDSAVGGINDILARRLGLNDLKPLTAKHEQQRFKLVMYAPDTIEQKVIGLLGSALAESCGEARPRSVHCVRSLEWGIPGKGQLQEEAYAAEGRRDNIRLEIELGNNDLNKVVDTLAGNELGERVEMSVLPLICVDSGQGLGRVGNLDRVMDLKSFARMVKKKLGLETLKFAGDPGLKVQRAAVCSGSGAGLLADFFACGAQVYVSGDLRYHDARDVEAANLGLVDIGHFASENLIVEALTDRLNTMLTEHQMAVSVKACGLEKDPFAVL